MTSLFLTSLAQAQTEIATTATSTPAGAQPSMWESILPFIFIFVAMYFIMIRPQTKKAKEHSDLLKNLKGGEEVVTSGGIIGRIKSIAEDHVTLEVGNTQMKVVKEHIARTTKTPKS